MERTSDDRHRAHARTVQTQLCHDNRNRMYALDEMTHGHAMQRLQSERLARHERLPIASRARHRRAD